jgi:hypothetical protein
MARKQFTFYESFFSALSRIKKAADRAAAYDSLCAYALYGTEPDFEALPDAAAIAFDLIKPTLDASRRKSESGKQGGSKTQANSKQTASKAEANCKLGETSSEKEKEKEKEVEIEYECIPPTPSPEKKKQKVVRHKRGEYGWVKLSDDEYSRLVNDLGQSEVDRCIKYVDESAQGTHNKNEWSDWNLVVRKCHREGWGLKQYGKPQQTARTREEMEQNCDWMKRYMRR